MSLNHAFILDQVRRRAGHSRGRARFRLRAGRVRRARAARRLGCARLRLVRRPVGLAVRRRKEKSRTARPHPADRARRSTAVRRRALRRRHLQHGVRAHRRLRTAGQRNRARAQARADCSSRCFRAASSGSSSTSGCRWRIAFRGRDTSQLRIGSGLAGSAKGLSRDAWVARSIASMREEVAYRPAREAEALFGRAFEIEERAEPDWIRYRVAHSRLKPLGAPRSAARARSAVALPLPPPRHDGAGAAQTRLRELSLS